ncbi:uncharacterized protein TNCV_1062591 [Trichonephila clavipes]|nr:uncharacterized protein TNCV_1062591 [Trichonephila clavipes]
MKKSLCGDDEEESNDEEYNTKYDSSTEIYPDNLTEGAIIILDQMTTWPMARKRNGRALDWFEVLGYRVVEDKATDYAHLKQALTEQFVMAVKLEGDNSRPLREFNRFESQGVADSRRFDGRRRGGQSDHRFHNQGGRQGGSRNSCEDPLGSHFENENNFESKKNQ